MVVDYLFHVHVAVTDLDGVLVENFSELEIGESTCLLG